MIIPGLRSRSLKSIYITMLEIKPITHAYPVLKPERIKEKDGHPPKRQAPKKPVAEENGAEQTPQPIDEMA